MEMTIEDTKTQLVMQKSYALGKDYRALENALDIIHKYQKIEQIIEDWERDKGWALEMSELYWLEMISEVIENGKIPTVEAIPKDQYVARLKIDMASLLKYLLIEIEDLDAPTCDYASSDCISKLRVQEIIQQKIDKLKGNKNGNK